MIEIDINGKPLRDFNEELNKTKRAINDINGEKLDGLNNGLNETADNVDKVTKSTKGLKAQLREMTNELQGLEPGSERFTELSIRAGQLRDTIADTNAVINATAGSAGENLGKSLSGVAKIGISGFQGIASAQALFGVESEKLQQTLVKLQALAGLSDAIESLGGMKDQITNIKAGFTAFGKSAKAALTGVKGAIAATGIGLLVVALGLAVAYWDDIKEAVSGVSAEQKELVNTTKKDLELNKEKLTKLNGQDNVLKLQGKSEREILKLKIAQTQEVINASIKQLEAQKNLDNAQIKAEQRNRDILVGIIEFINAPLRLLLYTVDEIANFVGVDSKLGKGLDNLIKKGAELAFDPAAVKKKSQETQKELQAGIDELTNQKAGYELEIKNIDKQASADAIASTKEKNDKKIEAEKELQKEIDQLQLDNYLKTLSEQEAEITLVEQKYFDLEQKAKGNADQLAIIEEAKLNAINDIKVKYAQIELEAQNKKDEEDKIKADKKAEEDKKLEEKKAEDKKKSRDAELAAELSLRDTDLQRKIEILEEQRAIELQNKDLTESEKLAITQKYINLEYQAKVAAAQAEIGIAGDLANSIANLTQFIFEIKTKKLVEGTAEEDKQARRRFKINKGLQLGLAIIDAAKAVTTSLAASPLAYGPVPNPAGIASLATAITSSAINIAKIASTQYESKSSGGGASVGGASGGGDSSSSIVPKTDLFGSANTGGTTTAGGTTAGQNINVNATISVEEITNTQNRMTKLKEIGSL